MFGFQKNFTQRHLCKINFSSNFIKESIFLRAVLLALIVLANVSDNALAAPTAGQNQNAFETLKEGVKKFTLTNGLRVVVFQRKNAPVFIGQTWAKVGGVDEALGKTGLAHLLEHMAFKGTETIGTKDYSKEKKLLARFDVLMSKARSNSLSEAEQVEAEKLQQELSELWQDNEFSRIYTQNGGVGLNAGTSKDYTFYTVSLPNTAFELWCWMESERLIRPVFRQFYKELEVVQEERRSRVEDSPGGQVYQTMLATAFQSHPNRLPVIGWFSDLKNLTVADMTNFYNTFYHPDNLVLVIVGDIDPQDAIPLLEKYFGRIPKSKVAVPTVLTVEEPQVGERTAKVIYPAEPELAMAYHKPTFPNADDAYFAILHTVLSDGRTSILYKELVEGKQLATAVATSEAPGTRFPSVFYVRAFPRKGVSNEQLRDAIQEILDRTAKVGFTEEQIRSAKKKVFVNVLQELRSNYGLAQMLGETEVLWGDWSVIFGEYDRIMETTNENIKSLVSKYLTVENRTNVFLEPSR